MATTEEFQPGDVVQLKSGGALMTVFHVNGTQISVFISNVGGYPEQRSNPLPATVLKKISPAPVLPANDALPPLG